MPNGWNGVKRESKNILQSCQSTSEFNGRINPYDFVDFIENLGTDDIVVTGNATACIVSFQAGKIKMGQRLFSNSDLHLWVMIYQPPSEQQ